MTVKSILGWNVIVASCRVPSDVPSALPRRIGTYTRLPHCSDLHGTLALRETSTANCKKSASNFKAMAFVWLLWLTVPTLLSNELSKLKCNCGPFEKLFKSYCEYKDGQMPGKHGWHDGSIQLCCEDGDLEAHAKSKKKPIKRLIQLRPSDLDELAFAYACMVIQRSNFCSVTMRTSSKLMRLRQHSSSGFV